MVIFPEAHRPEGYIIMNLQQHKQVFHQAYIDGLDMVHMPMMYIYTMLQLFVEVHVYV